MRKKNTKNIYHIIQFIDSARFMANSLQNLVKNLSERVHRIKCKFGYDDKKCGIKYKYCLSIIIVFLNIQTLKMILEKTNVYFAIRIAKQNLMKSYRKSFLIQINF